MMLDVLNIVFNELHSVGINLLITASIIMTICYAISNFFKWAPFRIIILLIAYAIISDILREDVILFNLNLYIALGIIFPHVKFVHILAYRIWYGIIDFYEKLKDFLYAVSRPFVFVYFQFVRLKAYYDARTQQKHYSGENEQSYQEFRQRGFNDDYRRSEQQYHRREEQSSQRENTHQSNENRGEQHNETSRWDSHDPYVILDISRTATQEEIKKQYRKLQKLYHPDLTQTKKEEYTRISQKINAAYSKLKN
jgi:hypothetical protein